MNDPEFTQDEYGEVINSPELFEACALQLKDGGALMLGWTDGGSTHLDILLARPSISAGPLQGGMNVFTDLFVAVRGFGMFGFETSKTDTHPGYIAEKLNLGGINETSVALADLINGVRAAL